MINTNKVRVSKLAIGLALALAAAPAFAQNTTSAMSGRVSDAGGGAVSGAQVTIVHTESGSVSNATTDAEGRYAARGLRVGGPYTVTITKDGKTETREGVYIELAQTANVDLRIEDATTLQAVQVTGTRAADLFDSKKMGAGTSINREKLNSLASIQRNLQDYARTDPRISQTDKGRGEISAGGQNSRFNSITIDGVSINDTFGLEANNLPTAKQPISIDAIQSVQVNISNYDVTQKAYTGANINAVTKSGTNDFKGSLYYVYRDQNAIGNLYNRSTDTYSDVPDFEESTVGMTFGGPLIEDKLFFFASYEELTSTLSTPSFGPIGSNLTNTAITNSSITGAQAIASTTWGFDAGTLDASSAELSVKDYLIKLDANLGENHRASLRWSKTEQSEPFFPGFSSTGLGLSSQRYVQEKVIESVVGQVFSDWTDNFSTEFKITKRDYDSVPINNSRLPAISLQFSGAAPAGLPTGSRFLNMGTEFSRHFNQLGTETLNVYAAANWFLGDHELKFGFDYDDNEVFNAFLQGTNGSYTFGCINSGTGVGQVTYTNPLAVGVNCATSSAAAIEAAVLENFRLGRPNTYQAQIAAPGFTINDGAAAWDYQGLGAFIQDTWSVNDKLTLTYGFRVDQAQMDTSPIFNAAASSATINGALTASTLPQNGTVTRAGGGFGIRNDVTIDGNSLFQPRVGFNYTFDTARPMQLRGGFGLFEGAAANVWLSNPYSNTGIATRITGCGGAFAACNGAVIFSPNPDTQPLFAGSPPAANVDFLSSELAQPSVWKFNLAFEHELPFFGMTFAAEFIRTEVNDAIYYKHLNLGQTTRTGTDGRQLYYTPAGYNTACWNGSNGSTNTAGVSGVAGAACNTLRTRALNNASFNNVLLAERTGKGGGNNLSFSLSGNFLEDWNYSIGYAYTSATEVSPLTSSVSNSNWAARSIFNPNEEVAANSAYLVRDRFTGQLNYKHNFFGNYATRFGLFYEGRKGKPYSWIYGNDLNGDGSANDLLYIPTAIGSNEVVFANVNTAINEEATFWSIINSNGLARYAGGVVDRNTHFAPWTHNFDIRISQEFPGFFEGNKASVVLDILNVGNMINKKWGRIDEIEFAGNGGVSRSFVNYLGLDAQGRYIYGVNGQVEDYATRQTRRESQWGAQLTVKYEF